MNITPSFAAPIEQMGRTLEVTEWLKNKAKEEMENTRKKIALSPYDMGHRVTLKCQKADYEALKLREMNFKLAINALSGWEFK